MGCPLLHFSCLPVGRGSCSVTYIFCRCRSPKVDDLFKATVYTQEDSTDDDEEIDGNIFGGSLSEPHTD